VHGRELVVRTHDALLGGISGRAFAPTRVLITDSSQVIEWIMTGTHADTRKPVALRGVALVWTRDDGSITDVHLYYDEALLLAQLGRGPKILQAVPPPQPPSGEREIVEQSRSAEEKTNLATVRASLEALAAGDEDAYLGKMADDLELVAPASAKPIRGKRAAQAYFRAMRGAIANLDTTVDKIWGIGRYVAVEYHLVGEQRGPIGWIPAQRDSLIKMFVVDIVEVVDRRIVRVWRYDNPGQILPDPERGPR
jgi:ketosteroid isomerase-like protein